MLTRIIDKLIVFLVMLTTFFIVVSFGMSGEASVISDDVLVVGILLFVIVAAYYELVRSHPLSVGLGVLLCVGIALKPDVMPWAVPAAVYGLVSTNMGTSDIIVYKYHKKPADKKMIIWAAAELLTAIGLIVFSMVMTGGVMCACCLAAVVLSLILSVKSAENRFLKQNLTAGYDEARQEAMNEHQLRELEMKNRENEIYMATLGERNRIAREIHDNVGHMLTRGIVQLQAVNVMNRDEALKPMLESVTETVNDAMTSIRKSVHELHDEAIDLSVGINDITKTLDERFDVKVSTFIESPASGKLKNAILGIIKEAVTNIAKYSKGNRVRVEVIENKTFWKVLVWDNGANEEFEYQGENLNGIGLEHIITRAQSVGGHANIVAGPDGFTVSAVIPHEK